MYPDVAPALRAWAAAGRQVAVYSSGSEEAQRLIFTHSAAGDLSDCITAYFDTRIGAKRDAASYRRIAQGLQAPPGSILFLSDIEAELDAAAEAGLATCQLVRPADATVPSPRHRLAADFNEVSRIAGLVPAKG
jgi:enolase-phosphatase E1